MCCRSRLFIQSVSFYGVAGSGGGNAAPRDGARYFYSGPLQEFRNIYGDAPEDDGEIAKIVYVYDVSGENIRLYNDMKNEYIICYRSNG